MFGPLDTQIHQGTYERDPGLRALRKCSELAQGTDEWQKRGDKLCEQILNARRTWCKNSKAKKVSTLRQRAYFPYGVLYPNRGLPR